MDSLRDRVPYSPIRERTRLQLPDGAHLAVWIIVNVEHWDDARAMPRTTLSPPMGQPLLPDVPHWSWHEYGMRVGFWRIFDRLRALGIVPTLAVNGKVCESYPQIVGAAHAAGWEFMGHGYVQQPMHGVADESASIRQTIEAIASVTGVPPRGWESPGLAETAKTIDYLSVNGIEYVADWVLDDQPVAIRATPKAVISLPYTVETNDVVMFGLQHHSAEELAKRCIAQFECLYEEGASSARVMAISVHPYLTGVPHRIEWFASVLRHITARSGVKIWTGAQILDWYLAQTTAKDA